MKLQVYLRPFKNSFSLGIVTSWSEDSSCPETDLTIIWLDPEKPLYQTNQDTERTKHKSKLINSQKDQNYMSFSCISQFRLSVLQHKTFLQCDQSLWRVCVDSFFWPTHIQTRHKGKWRQWSKPVTLKHIVNFKCQNSQIQSRADHYHRKI